MVGGIRQQHPKRRRDFKVSWGHRCNIVAPVTPTPAVMEPQAGLGADRFEHDFIIAQGLTREDAAVGA